MIDKTAQITEVGRDAITSVDMSLSNLDSVILLACLTPRTVDTIVDIVHKAYDDTASYRDVARALILLRSRKFVSYQGTILEYQYTPPTAEQLDAMDHRQIMREALLSGVDAKVVYGVPTCSEHRNFVVLTDQWESSKRYEYGIDILWCNQCYNWMRVRSK